MAGEIQIQHTTTGVVLYAIVRNSNAAVWNGSAFVTYVDADIANYDVALTEQGTASKFYAGDFPTVTSGIYTVTKHVRAGGSPAVSDVLAGAAEKIQWRGDGVVADAILYRAILGKRVQDTTGAAGTLGRVRIYDSDGTTVIGTLIPSADATTYTLTPA